MLPNAKVLAAFIESFGTWLITVALFGKPYFGLTIFFLILLHLLLRLLFRTEFWSLLGGFLAGIATHFLGRFFTDNSRSNLETSIYIVLFVLFIEFARAIIRFFAKGSLDPIPSSRQRFLFAIIGVIAFYVAQLNWCNIQPVGQSIEQLIFAVDYCGFQYATVVRRKNWTESSRV